MGIGSAALSIRNRIALGFGSVLLVCAVSGLVASFTLTSSERLLNKYDTEFAVATEFSKAQANFSEARIAGEAFILALEPDQLLRSDRFVETTRKQLKTALDQASDKQTRIAMVLLDKELGAYRGLIQNLQQGGLQADSARRLGGQGEAVIRRQNEVSQLLSAELADFAAALRLELTSATKAALAAMIAAFCLGCLASWFLSRSIADPIVRLTRAMVAVATGELDTRVPEVQRRDEIGEMARALNVFKENAEDLRYAHIARETEQRNAVERRRAEIDALGNSLKSSIDGSIAIVNEQAADLKISSFMLTEVAAQSNALSGDLVRRATEAAAAANQVAGAIEEMACTAASIAEAARNSSAMADKSALAGRLTAESVAELQRSITGIHGVLSLIRSVAEQTNLLSLNATIEAARAGSAGRGFAVVATEVKALSTQTANATSHIEAQIAEVLRVVARAGAAMSSIGESSATLQDIARGIATSAEAQRTTVGEIATATQGVVGSTSLVSRDANVMSEGARKTADSAKMTHLAAENLDAEAKRLERELEGFTASLRAG